MGGGVGERHVMRDERRDGRDEIEEGGGKWREEQRRSRRRRERERERERDGMLSHTTSSLLEQANQFASPHKGKTKKEKDRVNEPMLGTC